MNNDSIPHRIAKSPTKSPTLSRSNGSGNWLDRLDSEPDTRVIKPVRCWEAHPRPPRLPVGLGIGVITYNRLPTLAGCVEAIERHTQTPFHLVVADDGSRDGSSSWARESGIPVVTGRNYGCAWNKNRALAYLLRETRCDPILLLEEDCWPSEDGWEQLWIEAALRWGHVNYMTPFIENGYVAGGEGTAHNPFWSQHMSGQCTISRRGDLEDVGYLDTRFEGWGEEHVEWTHRFWKLQLLNPASPLNTLGDEGMRSRPTYANLNHGLRLVDVGTYEAPKTQKKNLILRTAMGRDPVQRPPFRKGVETQHFFREQLRAQWPAQWPGRARGEAQADEGEAQGGEGEPGLISVICPTRTIELAEQLQDALQGVSCERIWVWNGAGACPLEGKVVPYLDAAFHYEQAVNLGVMHSRGSVLFIVNDDVSFSCDVAELFRRLAALYQENFQVGACYGKLDGSWEALYAPEAPAFEGACWAISRRAFCRMGGLEESLTEYGGDEIVTRVRMKRLGFSGARLRGWTYRHTINTTYGPGAHNLKHMAQAATALGWSGVPEDIHFHETQRVFDVLWNR
jgi:GT2 family glycosyltransferase